MLTRREFLQTSLITGAAFITMPDTPSPAFESKRPPVAERRFTSRAVEETLAALKPQIADPEIAWLFENCFPNTLDTTVQYQDDGGKPDTFVITGDIDAMWLRDSSAQVWPYLPLASRDPALARLLRGVLRRQAQCILLDPYANAFLPDPAQRTQWTSDHTDMRPGVHERKWEVDSLCYPIRLAHGYWKQTGDTQAFDAVWEQAMDRIVQTFREQQRRDGPGPYHFQRDSDNPQESQFLGGYGLPTRPNGLISSMFRPSDDATVFPQLVPSNFFAAASLRHLAEIYETLHKPAKAAQASAFAGEVEQALHEYARTTVHGGTIYPYEVNGYGSVSVMDDANAPSLLSLPYLGAVPATDSLYQATRRWVWSASNPFFFEGKFAGVGSPHTGRDMIWPMSLLMRGLTSGSASEVAGCLRTLKATHAGTGFMHESFHKDDPARFTRSWFAWANTLFGELILHTAHVFPQVLKAEL